MKRVPSILLILIAVGYASSTLVSAQVKTRTLDQQKYRYKNEPLMMVSGQIAGAAFLDTRKLAAGPDWLKNLSLGMKNISSKNIAFFECIFDLDNPRKMPVQDSIALRFTGWPSFKDNTEFARNGGKRVVLKPGEVVKLSVSEQVPPVLINYLKNLETEDFDRVSIDIRYVHFDDGTGWALGHETREDPARPGSWIPVQDRHSPYPKT